MFFLSRLTGSSFIYLYNSRFVTLVQTSSTVIYESISRYCICFPNGGSDFKSELQTIEFLWILMETPKPFIENMSYTL